jgi:hypothetical protein
MKSTCDTFKGHAGVSGTAWISKSLSVFKIQIYAKCSEWDGGRHHGEYFLSTNT